MFRDSILKEAIEQGICHLRQTHAYQYIDNFQTILNTLNKTNTIFINKIKVEIKSPKVVLNQYGIVTSNYYQYELKEHNFTGIIIGPHFYLFLNMFYSITTKNRLNSIVILLLLHPFIIQTKQLYFIS